MTGTDRSADERAPVVLQIDPAGPSPDTMRLVEEVLAAGQLVAYPTDTFYGLGARPGNVHAVEALFRAKGRGRNEPLPLIASTREQLEALCGLLSATARRLADAFWPGPLTLVLPRGCAALAPGVTGGGDTVAVRVPDHLVARAVADAAGGWVTSTSANASGERPASTADDVVRALGARVSLVLDAGPTLGQLPSTIVDVTSAHPRLIRPGAVAFERVLESLQ